MGSPLLVAEEDPFRVIAELRGDVAFVIDCRTGLPTYVSPICEVRFGYGLADFIAHMDGSRPDSALKELCDGLGDRLRRFVAGDDSRKRVVRRFGQRCRNGRVIPIEIISTLLTGRDGGAVQLVGLVRDISDEHERLDEQRRFASMLNHEFRTPLSTIDGAIQRLEVTGAHADEPTRQRYRKISAAVDRLIGMLDQYLSPDRLEQIGYKPRANTVEPRQLLEEAAQQVRAAGRTVALDLGDLPATLRCQPDGLRMAVKVLVDNALRYAPEGTPIAIGGTISEGGLALTISDQGRGVPEDETALIFGKAYRARNALGQGAGLGLYMARSVIEVHGGTVSMRNLAPQGAEFRIWLPIQRPAGKYVASSVINCDNSFNQQPG
ncbi:MAG: ATP-binding protein [Gammaproteobacteria bacterium]